MAACLTAPSGRRICENYGQKIGANLALAQIVWQGGDLLREEWRKVCPEKHMETVPRDALEKHGQSCGPVAKLHVALPKRVHNLLLLLIILLASNWPSKRAVVQPADALSDAGSGLESASGIGLPELDSRSLRIAEAPIAEKLVSGGPMERPRLIPLVAAESGYSENSSVNILCTVSQGHHETLQFDWFKEGKLIGADQPEEQDEQAASLFNSGSLQQAQQQQQQHLLEGGPQIEKHPDHSLLRIARVRTQHGGRYTCAAKNQFGSDSSSVNLLVNGKCFLSAALKLDKQAS